MLQSTKTFTIKALIFMKKMSHLLLGAVRWTASFFNTYTLGCLESLYQCSCWTPWGTQCCFCSCQVALSPYSTLCGKENNFIVNWWNYNREHLVINKLETWASTLSHSSHIRRRKKMLLYCNQNKLHEILPWCNECIAIFIKLVRQQAFRNWWKV